MTIVVDNDFPRFHTFDYAGREKAEERLRVKDLVRDHIDNVDINDLIVGTIYNTRVFITVDVQCRCYDSTTDIIKQAKQEIPDRFHYVDDSAHVVDRLGI